MDIMNLRKIREELFGDEEFDVSKYVKVTENGYKVYYLTLMPDGYFISSVSVLSRHNMEVLKHSTIFFTNYQERDLFLDVIDVPAQII